VYELIEEPPLTGAFQSITTFEPLIVVVGGSGVSGTWADKIVTSEEYCPEP